VAADLRGEILTAIHAVADPAFGPESSRDLEDAVRRQMVLMVDKYDQVFAVFTHIAKHVGRWIDDTFSRPEIMKLQYKQSEILHKIADREPDARGRHGMYEAILLNGEIVPGDNFLRKYGVAIKIDKNIAQKILEDAG
jgi:hypothetical protein